MKYIKSSLSNKEISKIHVCNMRSTIATRTIYMYLPSQCRSSRFTSGEYHPMKKMEGTFTEVGQQYTICSRVNRLICLNT